MYGIDGEDGELVAGRGAIADDAFLEMLAGRRSVRRYRSDAVTPATIDALLNIATSVPSAHNLQPLRFRIVVSDKEKLRWPAAWDSVCSAIVSPMEMMLESLRRMLPGRVTA